MRYANDIPVRVSLTERMDAVVDTRHLSLLDGFDLEQPLAQPSARDEQLGRLMMLCRFGVAEVMTKITILRDEFRYIHEYNPIEHITARLKSMDSIVAKAQRKGIPLVAEELRAAMFDLAGVRVTCSFVSDIYRVRDMLLRQPDLVLLEERDYVARPKPNGYQSLHLIVKVPVFLSDRHEEVVVEIQLRTIAMDLWASLEHKIYYKYDQTVPKHLTDALKLAADVAASLDTAMERIHDEVHSAFETQVPPRGSSQGAPVTVVRES